MIFRNRVAKTKLVEQLTLVTLQTAHHGSTSPRIASTQRNHASRPVSTDFCNKICQNRKMCFSRELPSIRNPKAQIIERHLSYRTSFGTPYLTRWSPLKRGSSVTSRAANSGMGKV